MTKINSKHKSDNIYATEMASPSKFTFNQEVVDVFPDMINRSVPGYQSIIEGIGKIAAQYCPDDALVYDLGCSLGSVSLSVAKHLQDRNARIIAVDNSRAMVERCQQHLSTFNFGRMVSVQQGDLLHLQLQTCHFAVSNFTLQFIEPKARQHIIDRIYTSLADKGVYVLSEKIKVEDSDLDELLVNLHHDFKRENGYSDLEISQKRTALEDVMILDSLEQHKDRLKKAGFRHINVWFQHYNFLSLIAIK